MEVSFHLRNPKSEIETPINAYVWNGTRFYYPTGLKIIPIYWNKSANLPITKGAPSNIKKHLSEIKMTLESISVEIKNQFQRFRNENNRTPTNGELKILLDRFLNIKQNNGLIKNNLDLHSYIEKFIEESQYRINDRTSKTLSLQTIQGFKKCRDYLHSYSKNKNIKIDFKDIDLDFYYDFSKYLTKDVGFSQNTVGKQIRILKIFLNSATERGFNTNFAFKSKRFKVISENIDNIFLDKSELQEIYDLDLSANNRLDKVRDLFLIGCWTGMRFSDFSNIKPENIKKDYIELETKKTSQKVTIPLHPIVRKILEKYKGVYPNSLPPSISNVKMNLYIKELCKLVPSLNKTTSKTITKKGLKTTTITPKYELVTTHTARRSMASNAFLDGVPSEVIRSVTGHLTEKSFNAYIKLKPRDKADILAQYWNTKEVL